MASEDSSSAEKTEEPTARRLQKAREDGQVARSHDLSSAVLLFTATLFFSFSGEWLFNRMGTLFSSQLQFDRKIYDKAELLPAIFGQSVLDAYLLILPFMAVLLFVSVLSTGLSGGFIFSLKLAMPNFGKVSLLNGLSRMFGLRAWIELVKSIAKFTVIATILYLSVTNNLEELTNINQMELGLAVKQAGALIIDACFWMSLMLLLKRMKSCTNPLFGR